MWRSGVFEEMAYSLAVLVQEQGLLSVVVGRVFSDLDPCQQGLEVMRYLNWDWVLVRAWLSELDPQVLVHNLEKNLTTSVVE